jgi:hypothetical protein
LTLSQVEVTVLRSIGPVLTLVGLDGTTMNGTNPTLVEPIRAALQALGLPVASTDGATDDEVGAVAAVDIPRFYYLVEYFALEAAWGASLLMVDQSLGSESQSLSQIREGIMARLKWLLDRIGTLVPNALTPGKSVSGLIRAGRCYPVRPYPYPYHCSPYRGGWYYG